MVTGVKEKAFSVQRQALETLVTLTTPGAKQPAPTSEVAVL